MSVTVDRSDKTLASSLANEEGGPIWTHPLPFQHHCAALTYAKTTVGEVHELLSHFCGGYRVHWVGHLSHHFACAILQERVGESTEQGLSRGEWGRALSRDLAEESGGKHKAGTEPRRVGESTEQGLSRGVWGRALSRDLAEESGGKHKAGTEPRRVGESTEQGLSRREWGKAQSRD
ncbi:hypothetical protein JZ751_003547 [Albula glossodonta]|uniref:Uncharacterized protein n=1 Tax=Albula glossodonta TaxID=121402 RepID=A0A8T2N920_9TELE|nr:hypothetical protein JZ751_003547 [Albula glossodonta]